ncbi:MAG: hypothetical protein QM817_05360 [Archangium sp.]
MTPRWAVAISGVLVVLTSMASLFALSAAVAVFSAQLTKYGGALPHGTQLAFDVFLQPTEAFSAGWGFLLLLPPAMWAAGAFAIRRVERLAIVLLMSAPAVTLGLACLLGAALMLPFVPVGVIR